MNIDHDLAITLDVRHLRAIREIVRLGSVTAAAESLCVTQSALSHQLRQLEERLGVTLFERRTRPVRLSGAGERLLQAADRVLPEITAAQRDVVQIRDGGRGRLFLVLECHSCFQWLMPAVGAFRRHWPEVELDLTLSHGFTALDALRNGDVDAAVAVDPVDDPDLESVHLMDYENLLVVPAGHRLAERPCAAPEDLHGETLITYPVSEERLDIYRRFLHPAGLSVPRRTTEVSAMLLQLVASRRGVAVLPDWALPELEAGLDGGAAGPPATRRVRLGPEGLWSQLAITVRRADRERPYILDFVATARDILREARGQGDAD
ncbi:LysR family transcriptional regulator [Thioalkalivibrio sp. ALJT]|uniref:LysR family transcriptional regulator n=1 Tax=Thioalkalivibrio sp. ALJT TaxID=1158146 RepID=UPI00036A3DAC|nr:LysR family transcriptional regulator [Thioalkalivibrio sp. ALJT]